MSAAEHTELVNACLSRLALMGYAAWKNNTGVTQDGKYIKYGKKGSADIIAPLPLVINGLTYGIHVEIECKTGDAVLRKSQRTHRKVINRYGCPHYKVYSVDEMVAALVADGFDGCPASLPCSAFAAGR